MMYTEDIANALYKDCLELGIPVFRRGNIPDGEITDERVVILPKTQTPEIYWRKCFVEVNVCTPDIGESQANLSRLNELERLTCDMLDGRVGQYNEEFYRYSVSSVGIEKDDDMKCHYVNVRILFEVLNC